MIWGLFCLGKMQAQSDTLVSAAREDVEALTSRDMAGRGYHNEGHLKAAKYIESRFEEAGLLPFDVANPDGHPYFQSFYFPFHRIEDAKVVLNGERLKIGEDFIVNSRSGAADYSGRARDAGFGLRKKDGKVKRKHGLVVIREGFPEGFEDEGVKKKLKQLNERMKSWEGNEERIMLVGKAKLTASLSADHKAGPPQVEVLKSALPQKVKRAEVTIETKNVEVKSQNVIGWVKGKTNPDSFIVVSAHYDHLGQQGDAVFWGANDNASGTAMLISMAEHFALPENQPENSMVFIAFGGEEAGLIGSRHYVQMALNRGARYRFPLAQTRFILNIDLMGNGDEGITAVGGNDFPEKLEALRKLNTELEAVPKVKGRKNAPNSDHYWFLQEGVEGFFIYSLGGPPHYHDVNDTADELRFSRYVEVRNLLIEFLQEI